jgi:cytochrome c oxidase subunit 3
MTGIHGVHVFIGILLITFTYFRTKGNHIRQDDFILLENSGLYWHLVDLIWIYLFPLFYLIT